MKFFLTERTPFLGLKKKICLRIYTTNVSNNTITQNTKNNSLVNINTATTKELSSITGIGVSKASNIVKYREENGNFSSIEDIKNVSGIGDSLFEKIKKYITV